VFVDVDEPYNIYAGIQDHEHWKGPSNVASRGSTGERLARARWRRRDLRRAGYDAGGKYVYTTREYGQHFRLDHRRDIA
jgi:hypothetical protein